MYVSPYTVPERVLVEIAALRHLLEEAAQEQRIVADASNRSSSAIADVENAPMAKM
jgi:hypothetical protein